MIYFTSDLHLNHDRPFVYEPRGFSSIHEMNETIMKNIMETITDEDELFILGDLMLHDNSAISFIKEVRGKVHIVRGNHDTDERMRLYRECENVVEVCEGKFLRYGRWQFYLSHWPAITSRPDDQKKPTSRRISLCGHTHTDDKFLDFEHGLIYHVEVDAHNMMPVSIEEILEDIRWKLGSG